MSNSKINGSPIIVALDFDSADEAIGLVKMLDPELCRVKVGKELFTRAGPDIVNQINDLGFDVFLDLKFHDIPNTVANACHAAADLGVWMVNVHALGGGRMMQAARDAIDNAKHQPILIAVTILTSMGEDDLQDIGLDKDAESNVLRLAQLAKRSGMDGVVCSPQEVIMLREKIDESFILTTPGVRPAGSSTNDQKRVNTPEDTIRAGSDYLVIGRPITQADNPREALNNIHSVLLSHL